MVVLSRRKSIILSLHPFANTLFDLLDADRLHQHGAAVDLGMIAPVIIPWSARRDEGDGDMAELRVGLKRTDEGIPIHPRHIAIHENEVGLKVRRGIDGLQGIIDRADLELPGGQLEETGKADLVIDGQNPGPMRGRRPGRFHTGEDGENAEAFHPQV